MCKRFIHPGMFFVAINIWLVTAELAFAVNVSEIQNRGVLRHLGVRYANFVTGMGDGLDVELLQLYAKELGVAYEYVEVDWKTAIPALTGHEYNMGDPNLPIVADIAPRGDILANGVTLLPWREKLVSFSNPTFPTQVWLIAKAESSTQPIAPSNNIQDDIKIVKELLSGKTILCKANTCLDPKLYELDKTGANVKLFPGGLNELAPAIIIGDAEMTILDVPDALIALEKWPGRIKIIGPISSPQLMAVAFSKESKALQDSFEQFFKRCWNDGTYLKLVQKYYPAVFVYYPDFFASMSILQTSPVQDEKP